MGSPEGQVKRFTIDYYLTNCKEGYGILFQVLGQMIKNWWAKYFGANKNQPLSETSSERCLNSSEHERTTIIYGLHILSRLLATTLLWIPSFIIDIRLGLYPSKQFATFNYILCIGGFIFGMILTQIATETTIRQILPGLIKSVYTLISFMVMTCEFSYIFFGMFCLAYITYERKFFQEFVLYHGAMITTPRSFQREQAAKVFLTSVLFAEFSEPLFILMALYQDIDSNTLWPQLGPNRSGQILLKTFLIALVTIGASLVSLLSVFIPMITRFLVIATTKHIEDVFKKQLARSHRAEIKSRIHDDGLKSLLDKYTLEVINDYSCDTLTMNWPEITNNNNRDEKKQYNLNLSSVNEMNMTIINTPGTLLRRGNETSLSASNRGSNAGSLLFVYKNLVKSFSEIRGMIETYEKKFGAFHMVLTCIKGLIVCQWVVAGLTQARLNTNSKSGQIHISNDIVIGYKFTSFAFRTGIGVVMFIISNVFELLCYDCLPNRMFKMRSQLFKTNVDLACACLENQQEGLYLEAISATRQHQRQCQSHLNRQDLVQPAPDTNWSEIDQVWSLYDQIERMSARANFKFASNTYYNKNVLLTIFGREMSLLLLYVQVIDLYSYA